MADRLFEVLQQPERTKLPALRGVNKSSFRIKVEKMNNLLGKIRSKILLQPIIRYMQHQLLQLRDWAIGSLE